MEYYRSGPLRGQMERPYIGDFEHQRCSVNGAQVGTGRMRGVVVEALPALFDTGVGVAVREPLIGRFQGSVVILDALGGKQGRLVLGRLCGVS